MIVTVRWESRRWWCYVQQGNGRLSKVEPPSEIAIADGHTLEDWARSQWPLARVEFDEYEF